MSVASFHRLKGGKAANQKPVLTPSVQLQGSAGTEVKNSPRKRDQEEMAKGKEDPGEEGGGFDTASDGTF